MTIAIVGALVTLFLSLASATNKTSEATLKFVAAIKEMNRTAREARIEDIFRGLFGEVSDTEAEVARLEKRLRGLIGITDDFNRKVRELGAALEEDVISTKEFQSLLAQLQGQFEKASRVIITTREEIIELKQELADTAALDAFNDSLDALDVRARRVQDAFAESFITPLQAAQAQLAIARERVLTFAASFDTIDAEEIEARLPDFVQFQKDAEAARIAVEKLMAIDPRVEFRAAFADPIAANIGDAVFRGILEGAKAIEILGDIAQNVFTTALDAAIQGFQKGMSDVLTQIAGSAGGVIGNILTGIAGVAAGIFLNRRGESTNTFSEVQSRIESTQAVRGVVAGPTSIPIASVGSNLERAFVPVNERLDAMIEHLRNISENTSRGPAAGGGGFGFAGDVSTA